MPVPTWPRCEHALAGTATGSIVSGRKIWTSSAEYADWVYLAVRTDPDRDRHRGLSVLVADINTPGITVHTHRTLGGGTIGELELTRSRSPPSSLSAN